MTYTIAINRDIMTRISKQTLNQKTEKQLFSQFISLFSVANEKQHEALFSAIFTEAEKTMFIKRMAIVLLLLEEYSTYRIAKTLIVSDSTVRSIRAQYHSGRFDSVVGLMRKKAFDKEKFWKTIELLLRCGLPPRGRGRWKWLYEMK